MEWYHHKVCTSLHVTLLSLCQLNVTVIQYIVHSIWIWFNFFNCYLAAPRPTLGHYQGGSLTHLMLITSILHIRPEGHRGPHNVVGSLSPAECLVGFEPGTFWFWSQCLNPLGHSPPSTQPQCCLTFHELGFKCCLGVA